MTSDDHRARTPLDGAHDTAPEQQPRMTPDLVTALEDLRKQTKEAHKWHEIRHTSSMEEALCLASHRVLAAYDAAKERTHGR